MLFAPPAYLWLRRWLRAAPPSNVAAPTLPAADAPQNASATASRSFSGYVLPHDIRRICSDADLSVPHCEALVKGDGASNNGYVPSDLRAAYNLPSTTAGKGQMVAVVELGDDPNVESDLFMYRNTFSLPVCSTLNGCFIRVNQRGYPGRYPPPDANNAVETALDLDMVSAICPNCKILLVEAGNSWGDMAKAVDTAVNLGATIISVSYGGSDQHINPQPYDHPGVIILRKRRPGLSRTSSAGTCGTTDCRFGRRNFANARQRLSSRLGRDRFGAEPAAAARPLPNRRGKPTLDVRVARPTTSRRSGIQTPASPFTTATSKLAGWSSVERA